MLKKTLLASFLLCIAACSQSSKTQLGLVKKGPDESQASLNQDLMVPPVLDSLPMPSAVGVNDSQNLNKSKINSQVKESQKELDSLLQSQRDYQQTMIAK